MRFYLFATLSFGIGFLGVAATEALAQTNYATPYTFTTLAGTAGFSGSADGMVSAARFNSPQGIAVDTSGNAYVADTQNNTIRKITPAGVVTTLAGTAGSSGSADGTGSAAQFSNPVGVAVDGTGNVYVADHGNHTIRKITAAGFVTTLAGTAGVSGSADGTGSAAKFYEPAGVAVDASGNVYVADSYNITIRKITAAGAVTTLAGTPGLWGSADGTSSAARFRLPAEIAVDGSGNVYVSDFLDNTIRKITAAGVVTTLAGTAGISGSADGIGAAAQFKNLRGVAVDASGNVYVADNSNSTIRKITANGVVTTLAGTPGNWGSADGTGNVAQFYNPIGVAVDMSGNIYVADKQNYTIRKGTLSTPYQMWIENYGLSTGGTGADIDDPDGDGVVNLLEYALGESPILNNQGLVPVVVLAGDKLQISYSCSDARSDITYTVQYSTDLITWFDITNSVGGIATTAVNSSGATISDVGSGLRTITVTNTNSVNMKQFIRLQVTRP